MTYVDEELKALSEQEAGKNIEAPEVKSEGQLLEERETEGKSFWESVAEKTEPLTKITEPAEAAGKAITKDLTPGSVAKAAFGGVVDIPQDMINTAHDVLDWGEGFLRDNGIIDTDIFEPGKATDFAERLVPLSDNPIDNMVRGTVSFLVPFAGISKMVKGGSAAIKASKALTGSAIVNGIIQDPDDKRVSDYAKEVPMIAPFIPSFLISKEDDSAFESRVKNTVESFIVDAGVAGIGIGVAKVFKGLRKGKELEFKLDKASKEGTEEVVEQQSKKVARVNESGDIIEEQVPVLPQGRKFTKSEEEALENVFTSQGFTKEDLEKLSKAYDVNSMREAFKGTSKAKAIDDIAEIAKRGKIPQDETFIRAVSIVLDDKKMKDVLRRSHEIGTVLNAEELAAVQYYSDIKFEEFDKLFSKVKNFDSDDPHFLAATIKANEVMAVSMGYHSSGSEIGRALNIMGATKKDMDISNLRKAYLDEYIKYVGETNAVDFMQQMKKVRDLKTPKDLKRELGKISGKYSSIGQASQWFKSYYLSNLISGVGTTARAMVGNASYGVVRSGELAIQGMVTPFIKGASVGEVTSAMKAVPAAWSESLTSFKEFMLDAKIPDTVKNSTGRFSTDDRSYDRFLDKALDKLGILPEEGTSMRRATNVLGTTISGTGRLQSVDAFSKVFAERVVTNQLTHRYVLAEGLEEGTESFAKRMGEVIANPPVELIDEIDAAGRRASFSATSKQAPIVGFGDDSVGNTLDYFEKGLDRIPILNVTVPFVRTQINLADFTIQRIPGLNRLHPRIRADFAAGGSRAAEATSKSIMGTMVLGIGASLAAGGHITGGNKNARKLKKDLTGNSRYGEYVLNLPGFEPIQYDRLDPVGALLGMSADLAEISGLVPQEKAAEFEDVIGAVGMTIKDAMIPGGVIEDFKDVLAFIDDPRGKRVPISTTGFIPQGALLKEIGKSGVIGLPSLDPVKRDTRSSLRDQETRKMMTGLVPLVDEIINSFKDSLGFGEDAPPLLNALGDETVYPPGVKPEYSLPMFRHDLEKDNMDPVYKELYRLAPKENTDVDEPMRAVLSMPPRYVNMGVSAGGLGGSTEGVYKYELTPKEYHKFVQFSSGIGVPGPTLKQSLGKLFNNTAYKNGNDLFKKALINNTVREYRNAGKGMMMKYLIDNQDAVKTIEKMNRKYRIKLLGR